MKKLTISVEYNYLNGSWLCCCKEYPMQSYICETKKDAEKMAIVVQDHFNTYGNFQKPKGK